jgi:hypothetical protein
VSRSGCNLDVQVVQLSSRSKLLVQWLTEDGVYFDSDSLPAALQQLEHSGRIKRDVAEHSWSSQPVGGWYMAPHIYDER